MLFKAEHRIMICEGTKTETRRPDNRWRRPAKPGVTRGFYTRPAFANPPGVPFCRAEILEVFQSILSNIDTAGAKAEGYKSVTDYGHVWDEIWGSGAWYRQRYDLVWVVKFKLVEQLRCAYCGGGDRMQEHSRVSALICRPCIDLLDFPA